MSFNKARFYLLFFIFFLNANSIYSKPKNEKMDNYIDYCLKKGIIDPNFLDNTKSLSKNEFLLSLYKTIALIDKNKVSKEDFEVLGLLIAEINNSLVDFQNNEKEQDVDIEKLKNTVAKLEMELSENKAKIIGLENRLDESNKKQKYGSSFGRGLMSLKLNNLATVDFSEPYINFNFFIKARLTTEKGSANINYFLPNGTPGRADSLYCRYNITENIFVDANSRGHRVLFNSYYFENFYNSYSLEKKQYNIMGFGLGYKDSKIYLGYVDDKTLNTLININLRFFSFSEYFMIGSGYTFKNNFLEAAVKVPFSETFTASLGFTNTDNFRTVNIGMEGIFSEFLVNAALKINPTAISTTFISYDLNPLFQFKGIAFVKYPFHKNSDVSLILDVIKYKKSGKQLFFDGKFVLRSNPIDYFKALLVLEQKSFDQQIVRPLETVARSVLGRVSYRIYDFIPKLGFVLKNSDSIYQIDKAVFIKAKYKLDMGDIFIGYSFNSYPFYNIGEDLSERAYNLSFDKSTTFINNATKGLVFAGFVFKI